MIHLDKAKNRTSTRDQAIRKRYSNNFSAKSPKVVVNELQKKKPVTFDAAPGTVMSMGPVLPVKVDQSATVTEIARLMAGRRADAVLVENENEGLVGIVTDKDLAYRVVAEGLDASKVKVETIMTPNPVFVRSNATVEEAMNKMLNGHFRHLPVVEDNKAVALVDITKVIHHMQSKIRNSWGKAETLLIAFQEFKNTWQNFHATPEVERWFGDWSSRMVEPDLSQVMQQDNLKISVVGMKNSVLEAAKKMKECRQTAVLVYDKEQMVGIFTSKDVVLRVLAPNESDPSTTTILRVMTPNPESASDKIAIGVALKTMHDGHYLHLPVYSGDKTNIVGLVDVLHLTYHTMETLIRQQQMNPLTPVLSSEASELMGPLWQTFWNNQEDFEGPESDDNSSTMTARRSKKHRTAESECSPKRVAASLDDTMSQATTATFLNNTFVFKFRDPMTGRIHKFSHRLDTEDGRSPFITLLESVLAKIGFEIIVPEGKRSNEKRQESILEHYNRWQSISAKRIGENGNTNIELQQQEEEIEKYHFRISYSDEEKDPVLIMGDGELLDAVEIARNMGWSRLTLMVEAIAEYRNGRRIAVRGGIEEQSITPDRWSEDTAIPRLIKEGNLFMEPTFWVSVIGAMAVAAVVSSRIFGK